MNSLKKSTHYKLCVGGSRHGKRISPTRQSTTFWVKSRVLSAKYDPITKSEAEIPGWKEKYESDLIYDQITEFIADQIDDLVRRNSIANAIATSQFLNPISEVVEDNEDDLINLITDAYSTGDKAYNQMKMILQSISVEWMGQWNDMVYTDCVQLE